MKKIEYLLSLGGIKKDIIILAISGFALLLSILNVFPNLPFNIAWIAIILSGIPIIAEAVIGIVTSFDIKADVLVSLALIAAICINEDFAAGEVAFIMQLGALLEDITVTKAKTGIEKLINLTPQTARIINDNNETIVPAENVKIGNILKIFPGETIPVDGIIVKGQTSINQSAMTGESFPVDKSVGDSVMSGTVNQFGAFEMKATKVGENSSIQRMIKLVQSADASKAKIVGLADKWATWIVIIALASAILTWIITKEPIRAVTILVVFCPCSLVLATPTAIMAAIGNATKHGFLVKEGDALERLSKVKKVTFDKTGTLTTGLLNVVFVKSLTDKYTDEELYLYTASAEKNSEHPLGKAIVNCYKKINAKKLPETTDFKMIPGKGIMAVVEGKNIGVGNEALLSEMSIKTANLVSDNIPKGMTVAYITLDNILSGIIALSDSLRNDSKETISRLLHLGITPVLLTGDNKETANQIANKLGIKEVYSNCLPKDKLSVIDKFQINKNFVCMVGDGINDAPSLKKALVGIAMGGDGSDIAVEAADITLINDDIKELPHLFSLSKYMMKKIKFNLIFSMLLNFTAIILAMTGILNPIIGALVHNAGSVFVIINSAFLLTYTNKN